jgi:hypothetical protein
MDDKYDYFCLVGFDTEVKDTDCIIRRGKETATLEFCNQYRGWTENPDLRRIIQSVSFTSVSNPTKQK